MKINGIDVLDFMAKQVTVDIGLMDNKTTGSWLDGAVMPLPNTTNYQYKTVKVKLSVHGVNGREDIIRNCSKIISICRGDVDFELDGFSHKFRGYLSKYARTERVMHKWHHLELTFNCYEYGETITEVGKAVTADNKTYVTIRNTGTAPSPVILTLDCRTTKYDLEINGLCKDDLTGEDIPVIIPSIENGKQIILNGQTGLFTEDGQIKEVTIWKIPYVDTGETVISCNSLFVDMKAEVIPIYI